MTSSSFARVVFVGLALAGVAGCVAPSELDRITQDCDGQRFDAPTRDAWCSGRWEKSSFALGELGQVTSLSVFAAAGSDETVVALGSTGDEGDRISLLLDGGDDQQGGRVLEDSGSMQLGRPEGDASPRQLAVLGDAILEPGSGVPRLSAAVLFDADRLGFFDGPVSARASDVWAQHSQTLDDPISALPSGQSALDGCSNAGSGIQFASLEALPSTGERVRRMGLVAMGCRLVVYGKGYTDMPAEPLMELPLAALAMDVDTDNDRLFVAAGADGLKVRSLTSFERGLFEAYDARWPEVSLDLGINNGANNGSPAPGCEDPSDCFDADPEDDGRESGAGGAAPPEPIFDRDPGLQAADPGEFAHINITRVAFSGDRVMVVNGAIDVSGDEGRTLLISGHLSAANTLEERLSVEIADDDRATGEVEWSLAPVGADHFAVFRRVLAADGAAEGGESWIAIYDAPTGQRPSRVFELPLEEPPIAMASHGGDLYLAWHDRVDVYRVEISGEPLP